MVAMKTPKAQEVSHQRPGFGQGTVPQHIERDFETVRWVANHEFKKSIQQK